MSILNTEVEHVCTTVLELCGQQPFFTFEYLPVPVTEYTKVWIKQGA